MNAQRNLSDPTLSVSLEVEGLKRSSETITYITDLMVELQTIANVSGLSALSDDIDLVVKKHVT
jgi:hypothetical protein